MEWDEVKDLMDEVFICLRKKAMKIGDVFVSPSDIHIYDSDAKGCKLGIKASLIDDSTRSCVKSIVEKRKLKFGRQNIESQEYLVIYKPRKT